MPLITIIIPTYNCYSYLKDCVSRLVELNPELLEIIIVNDGSTDETFEYLESIKKEYPQLTICHKENAGVSLARNDAVDKANGKYIYFCDSDDEIIKDSFSRVVEFISKNDHEIIICNFSNQNSDLKNSRTYYHRTRLGLQSGPEFLIHSLEHKEYGSEPCQFFFKRSLFGELRFIKGMLHEDDQLFTQLIFRAKKVFVTNETIYFRNYRLDSLSRDSKARPRNNAKDLLFLIETYSKLMNSYNNKEAFRVFKTLTLRSWMMIFDFFNKVPESRDLDILNQRPSLIKTLLDSDISLRYRIRYLGRIFKIKK